MRAPSTERSSLNDRPERPGPYYDRRLVLAAVVIGMAAILALPLSFAAPWSVTVLVFATPLLLAVTARIYELRWLFGVAGVLLLVLAAAVLLEVLVLSIVAAIVLLVGPIVAVVVVGSRLRQVDLVASGSFLLSGTIAVVAGFATAELSGAAAMIVGIGLVGVAVASARIGRLPDSAA